MSAPSEASGIVKRRWGHTRGVWKAALLAGLVVLAMLVVAVLALWLAGRLVKSLTAGGSRNRDLYIPRARRQ